MFLQILTIVILTFGAINLFRIAVYMIAADFYDVKNQKQYKNKTYTYRDLPKITILIPAYNEEVTIEKTVRSVLAADYPYKEIFVIDDGSKDKTSEVTQAIIAESIVPKLQLLRQENAGKGAALNNGIAHATGELVMVLDADSTIDSDALMKSVKYFKDPQVKAIASNVGLIYNGLWLGLLQKVEYLLSYRMKRSLTALNNEYIIGGVGSVYRLETLKAVSGYRTDTITEDIDLSLNVISSGNKANRVIFASDVHTRTEPVHDMKDLISQRYRWKLGRLQAFMRYRGLFLSEDRKHSKTLTWFQLPYAIVGELYLLLEPLFIGAILFVSIVYGDTSSLPIAFGILGTFMLFNFIASEELSFKEKLGMIYMIPAFFFMLPVLGYVELVSLLKSIKNWRRISPNSKESGHWTHVKRLPKAV